MGTLARLHHGLKLRGNEFPCLAPPHQAAERPASGTGLRANPLWTLLWSRLYSMETIQVVLDRELLQAADRAARRSKQNRSALIRDALREHLRRLQIQALEQRDRDGYSKVPRSDEGPSWEAEAAWPEE